jgi:hypothetical protein
MFLKSLIFYYISYTEISWSLSSDDDCVVGIDCSELMCIHMVAVEMCTGTIIIDHFFSIDHTQSDTIKVYFEMNCNLILARVKMLYYLIKC